MGIAASLRNSFSPILRKFIPKEQAGQGSEKVQEQTSQQSGNPELEAFKNTIKNNKIDK